MARGLLFVVAQPGEQAFLPGGGPMDVSRMAPFFGSEVSKSRMPHGISDDVVEIGLFLPSHRAEALIALSRRRRQSVGQILRGLIDQAIAAPEN